MKLIILSITLPEAAISNSYLDIDDGIICHVYGVVLPETNPEILVYTARSFSVHNSEILVRTTNLIPVCLREESTANLASNPIVDVHVANGN